MRTIILFNIIFSMLGNLNSQALKFNFSIDNHLIWESMAQSHIFKDGFVSTSLVQEVSSNSGLLESYAIIRTFTNDVKVIDSISIIDPDFNIQILGLVSFKGKIFGIGFKQSKLVLNEFKLLILKLDEKLNLLDENVIELEMGLQPWFVKTKIVGEEIISLIFSAQYPAPVTSGPAYNIVVKHSDDIQKLNYKKLLLKDNIYECFELEADLNNKDIWLFGRNLLKLDSAFNVIKVIDVYKDSLDFNLSCSGNQYTVRHFENNYLMVRTNCFEKGDKNIHIELLDKEFKLIKREKYGSEFVDIASFNTTYSFYDTNIIYSSGYTFTNDNNQFFVARYNANLDLVWLKYFGDKSNYTATNILALEDRSCIVSGGYTERENSFDNDPFILKIDSLGNPLVRIEDIPNVDILNISISPNPCTDFVIIELKDNDSKITVKMDDENGREVLSRNIIPTSNKEIISLIDLPSGIYIFKFYEENKLKAIVRKQIKL